MGAMTDVLELVPSAYPSGVALWGALPPVYDTTSLPVERGVHVHARSAAKGGHGVGKKYPSGRGRA
jgi:hypothetical protein